MVHNLIYAARLFGAFVFLIFLNKDIRDNGLSFNVVELMRRKIMLLWGLYAALCLFIVPILEDI